MSRRSFSSLSSAASLRSRIARFAASVERYRNRHALDAEIEAWTRTRDAVELMNTLQAAGVTAGALLDEEMAYADPHLRARGFFQSVAHREAGTREYPVGMWESSAGKLGIRGPAPCLGEHNDYVYREILGYSDARIREMTEQGHIGDRYAPHVK